MSLHPALRTSNLARSTLADTGSPSEQRDDAKKNMLKAMRPLPIQHYWRVWFDRQQKDHAKPTDTTIYHVQLEQLGDPITSVQEFWRYNNNTPIENVKMRDSLYLFKEGYKPIWEDRRNLNGGSWTFRVPKDRGPDFWTRVQLMAIGEKLQACLDGGDQLCGVGLSVRFNSHLISIWHRDSSKQKSIDGMLATVFAELPDELKPKGDNYFYKKHSDHSGFKHPDAMVGGADATAAANRHGNSGTGTPSVAVEPATAVERLGDDAMKSSDDAGPSMAR